MYVTRYSNSPMFVYMYVCVKSFIELSFYVRVFVFVQEIDK